MPVPIHQPPPTLKIWCACGGSLPTGITTAATNTLFSDRAVWNWKATAEEEEEGEEGGKIEGYPEVQIGLGTVGSAAAKRNKRRQRKNLGNRGQKKTRQKTRIELTNSWENVE